MDRSPVRTGVQYGQESSTNRMDGSRSNLESSPKRCQVRAKKDTREVYPRLYCTVDQLIQDSKSSTLDRSPVQIKYGSKRRPFLLVLITYQQRQESSLVLS